MGTTAVNKVKCAGMLLTQEAARPSAAVGGSERQGWKEDRVLLFPLFWETGIFVHSARRDCSHHLQGKSLQLPKKKHIRKTAPFPSHCVWRSPSSLTSQGNLESLLWLSCICHLWCQITARQDKLHKSANSKWRREKTKTTWSASRRGNLISSQA